MARVCYHRFFLSCFGLFFLPLVKTVVSESFVNKTNSGIYETKNVSSGDFIGVSGETGSRDFERVNVTCSAGTFIGQVETSVVYGNKLSVKQFLGIPYAQPPTGNLRFKKPIEKTLKMPYDATSPKATCLDLETLYYGGNNRTIWEGKSEDCLYLNIFVPVDEDQDEPLPVIIYIHETTISVQEIAKISSSLGKVAFVHINFRMNIWGFLNSDDGVIPGNIGLWDQHMAIRWVQDNIDAFGGNPYQVTLMGYFEGASNVIYQAMFPSNAGLFKRIIVHCGGVHCPWVFNAGPKQTTKLVAKAVGCHNETSRELLRCMSSKTLEEIFESTYRARGCINIPSETLTSIDDAFLRYPPNTLLNPESELELPELKTLSKYDFLTSIIQIGGSMLIKVRSNQNGIGTLYNHSNPVYKAEKNSDDKTDIIPVEMNDTLMYDYEVTYDTKHEAKFSDPLWELSRVMFGLNFDSKIRKQLTRDINNLKCDRGQTSCFFTSLSHGGRIWRMMPYCLLYDSGAIIPEEEYAKYGLEYTSPPLFMVRNITDFQNILIDADGLGSKEWIYTDGFLEWNDFEHLKVAVDIWTSFAKSGALSSVVALGANIICNKIPGLAPRQRAICRSRPVAIAVIGGGARLGLNECQYQFRNMRWNCTMASKYDSMFGYQHDIASREAAVWSAMSSSGVVYAITQACSLGSLKDCGCDKSKKNFVYDRERDFTWGGCSADVKYGLKLARKFLDAREIEQTARSLMNKHNNRVGRKAVRDNMKLECRCHGPTGSCTVKTCWKRLPSFRDVGEYLLEQYHRSRQVVPWRGNRLLRPNFLVLKKSNRPNKKPRRRDLVYLERSPNFCEYNLTTGSLGTVGRKCNKGSKMNDGCTLMCCGRGYNTHQYTRTWQCNCTFHWCCVVNCKDCSEKRLEYTCK